jgi:hypothetical protein
MQGVLFRCFWGEFALSRFILHLSRLEDAFERKVKTESTMESSPALKAAIETSAARGYGPPIPSITMEFLFSRAT